MWVKSKHFLEEKMKSLSKARSRTKNVEGSSSSRKDTKTERSGREGQGR